MIWLTIRRDVTIWIRLIFLADLDTWIQDEMWNIETCVLRIHKSWLHNILMAVIGTIFCDIDLLEAYTSVGGLIGYRVGGHDKKDHPEVRSFFWRFETHFLVTQINLRQKQDYHQLLHSFRIHVQPSTFWGTHLLTLQTACVLVPVNHLQGLIVYVTVGHFLEALVHNPRLGLHKDWSGHQNASDPGPWRIYGSKPKLDKFQDSLLEN